MRPGWAEALSAAAFLVLVTPAVARADEPADLLIRAAEASRTQTYQGVVIYRDDERFESLRVVHRYADGHERERVTSLNGEPRDIFREDNRVWCVLPKDHMLLLERPTLKGLLSQLSPERLAALVPFYELKSLGRQRVAGRDCDGVAIAPRDRLRYGYEVWSDRASGLPLRISLFTQGGRIVEQVMFTEVNYPASIPDAAFQTELNTAKFKLVPTELKPALSPLPAEPVVGADPGWRYDGLPAGFQVIMHDERNLADGSGRVAHTLLSDGLASVSVFREDGHDADHHYRGLSHMGSVQAYSLMVDRYHVTVVGEAPSETVRMIGDGLGLAGPAPDRDVNAPASPPAPR